MTRLRPPRRRALILAATILTLGAGIVATPAVAQSVSDLAPLDPINSIPTTAPVTIRPRLFTAYGTLIAAGMLGVLYLYRSRVFILYWLGSLLLLTAALAVTSAIGEAAPGSSVNGGALLSLMLSAGLLKVAADAFPNNRVRWKAPLRVAGVMAAWSVLAPLAVAFDPFVNTSLLVTAALLTWSGWRYFEIARVGRQLGALVMAIGLSIVGAGTISGVLVDLGVPADHGLVHRLAAVNVVTSLFLALGMLLLVFEEVTGELQRSNRDLATAHQAAHRLAVTDMLTGCHNRHFFEEIERREMYRHLRYGTPLSVVFIDVNRLKQLNDTFGHERGDEALRSIGAMLRREVRESDYVIRWGGDEFLLLLTCPFPVARRTAERLKRTFREDHGTARLAAQIGLSIGVAAVAAGADGLRDAIREADALMYRDKLEERSPLQVR